MQYCCLRALVIARLKRRSVCQAHELFFQHRVQGDVSFDNIGRALLQVVQMGSLESWSTTQIYYLLQMPILVCMQGDVSFDNIGRARLQVLQVVSLETLSTT